MLQLREHETRQDGIMELLIGVITRRVVQATGLREKDGGEREKRSE